MTKILEYWRKLTSIYWIRNHNEIILYWFTQDSPKEAASEGWGRSPSCRMRKGSALRLHSIEKIVMLPGKSLEGVVWINTV